MEANIILLAQPLMKNRCWDLRKTSYKKDAYMFNELGNLFKIEKLEEVLRCSDDICRITKFTQTFVRDKDSAFKTSMNRLH